MWCCLNMKLLQADSTGGPTVNINRWASAGLSGDAYLSSNASEIATGWLWLTRLIEWIIRCKMYSKPSCSVSGVTVSHTLCLYLQGFVSMPPLAWKLRSREQHTAIRPGLWQPICHSPETKIDDACPDWLAPRARYRCPTCTAHP